MNICGVISNSGPNQEPLACAYEPGHTSDHSWATLPTFANGHQVITGRLYKAVNVNGVEYPAGTPLSEVPLVWSQS